MSIFTFIVDLCLFLVVLVLVGITLLGVWDEKFHERTSWKELWETHGADILFGGLGAVLLVSKLCIWAFT